MDPAPEIKKRKKKKKPKKPNAPTTASTVVPTAPEVKVLPAQVVTITPQNLIYKPDEIEALTIGDATVRKRKFLGDRTGLKNIVKTTDVVPSVYEGGFKLWECALDLVAYLQERQVAKKHTLELKDKRVAEIGCGHGLPGVYCLQQGAKLVSFQDLNAEVLAHCTAVNVHLNGGLETKDLDAPDRRAQFFAGDWSSAPLKTLMTRGPAQTDERSGSSSPTSFRYDLVLSSETIYASNNQPALLDLIAALLRPATPGVPQSGGVAYIAAKRFYFGVGGSTGEFLDLVNRRSDMKGEVCKVLEDQQSTIREILKITMV